MFDVKNTYWSSNGEYQRLVDELSNRAPGHGYTSNVYVNIYLVMAHLYYDAYNNGGGNIKDSYEKDFRYRVEPYLGDKVNINAFINEDFSKMEAMMNTVIEFIKDKNLDFPIYSFWCNHEAQMISDYKPIGELADKGYWFEATFGEPEELERFKKNWCSQYEVLTSEFKDCPVENISTEKYYEIALLNFDDNNVPESAGTVYCHAHKEMTKQEAAAFCREELGMSFEEVGSVIETTREETLEYYDSENDIPVFDSLSNCQEKESLDDVIMTCEELNKGNNVKASDNEYYKASDGFFDFYVNNKTGEKKFKLDEGDVEVKAKFDDFYRGEER